MRSMGSSRLTTMVLFLAFVNGVEGKGCLEVLEVKVGPSLANGAVTEKLGGTGKGLVLVVVAVGV